MGLSPGTRLGAYEIVGLIGAGGMGEVYRARDTRLDRTVAIKVLPDSLAADPQFRERFDREARAISQLTHPHICVLHDVGHHDGSDFLVMEYLEGEPLEQRLQRGALPVTQALQYAIQMADALDKAHRSGIVHRDLKPGNIMLTKGGAKLLDFGLAKSVTSVGAIAGLSMLPTTPPGLTAQGTILGTFQYMAPEQLEGKEADARTDIFAFGAVLYEMLTRKKAFEAKSQASLIASILEYHPPPPSTVQPLTPRALDRVAATCLAKDPDDRWQSARDLMRELTWIAAGSDAPPDATARLSVRDRHSRRIWAGLTGVLLIGAIVAAILLFRPARGASITRVLVDVRPADQLHATPWDDTYGHGRPGRTAMVFAPDGQSLVFSAIRGAQQQLYWRPLQELDAEPIAGTEGGAMPFFSPDGKWLGFWVSEGSPGGRNELRKVPFPRGGPAVKVCETPLTFFGASWGANDTIVFALTFGGLWQVAAAGGSPRSLTTLDPTKEHSHRLPVVLPGGQAVLFTATRSWYGKWDETEIVIQSLVTGERKLLIAGGADARYIPTGHLVFMRMGTLMAVPFDLQRGAVTGNQVALVANVMQALSRRSFPIDSGAGQFSVSPSGALLYLPGGVPPDDERTLFWVDRKGVERPLSLPALSYTSPRLSPDGQQLAFSTSTLVDPSVWVFNLLRGGQYKLTTECCYGGAVWTPDGKRVAFTKGGRPYGLFSRVVDGSGPVEQLAVTSNFAAPHSWTPDGSTLAFVDFVQDTNPPTLDISVLPLNGDRRPRPWLHASFQETQPEFSPNGRWLAYSSLESGRQEVFVQAYPDQGATHLISTGGGIQPVWSREGRELFFTTLPSPDGRIKMMAVPVTADTTWSTKTPEVLFENRYVWDTPIRTYDVAPDGRFLMMRENERPPLKVNQMILVQNWTEELKRRVPTN